MRRVWAVYVMRRAASPMVRVGVLAASILAITASVSITNVVENLFATRGVVGVVNFSLSAITRTSFAVQVSSALVAVIILWFVTDTVRTAVFMRQMRAA